MSVASVDQIVQTRYAQGARARVAELCCPTDYDPRYLDAIPEEVLERDYGCGDPSRYLRPGETVLDLGSGTGKICFIAAQVVGPEGRVIGVDMTPDMLDVARRNAPQVAQRIGFANVEFRRGRIQDLALDLDAFDRELAAAPANTHAALVAAHERAEQLRQQQPLIESASVDVVVSNCVLNLVDRAAREQLFAEIHRVLRRGGRAVISDIVSDEVVPEQLQRDADLWSGCIAGAFTELGLLEAFEAAGFYGISVVSRQAEPWRTVEGIEFRSMTVEAFKGKEGACVEKLQAVVYRGPFKEVLDDDGHRLRRGVRHAVCAKTFELYGDAPYREHFDFIEPLAGLAAPADTPFDCERTAPRDPRETKRGEYRTTSDAAACCEPGSSC